MAVTIDEMHVEVKDHSPAASASPSSADAKPEIDLRSALEMVHQRKLRLKAD